MMKKYEGITMLKITFGSCENSTPLKSFIMKPRDYIRWEPDYQFI